MSSITGLQGSSYQLKSVNEESYSSPENQHFTDAELHALANEHNMKKSDLRRLLSGAESLEIPDQAAPEHKSIFYEIQATLNLLSKALNNSTTNDDDYILSFHKKIIDLSNQLPESHRTQALTSAAFMAAGIVASALLKHSVGFDVSKTVSEVVTKYMGADDSRKQAFIQLMQSMEGRAGSSQGRTIESHESIHRGLDKLHDTRSRMASARG